MDRIIPWPELAAVVQTMYPLGVRSAIANQKFWIDPVILFQGFTKRVSWAL